IGVLAHAASDAAAVLQVIAGRDPHDATTADVPVPDYSAELNIEIKGMRLGVSRALLGEGLSPDVRAAIEKSIEAYRDLGAHIVATGLRPGLREMRRRADTDYADARIPLR